MSGLLPTDSLSRFVYYKISRSLGKGTGWMMLYVYLVSIPQIDNLTITIIIKPYQRSTL